MKRHCSTDTPNCLHLSPDPTYTYKAYGLTINSFIELPDLPPSVDPPDVSIKFDSTAINSKIEQPPLQTYVTTTDSQMILWLAEYVGANFRIQNGNEIFVEIVDPEQSKKIQNALLGFCLTALLFQRGYLVLHGNVIDTLRGSAIAICGHQQSGKSTTSVALSAKGYKILADDLVAIATESALPFVEVGVPKLRLWRDTLEYFGKNPSQLNPVENGIEKYHFPIDANSHTHPQRLVALYILQTANIASPTIRRISGLKKFHSICHQLRSYQAEQLPNGTTWLVEAVTALASTVHVNIIERPVHRDSIEEVAQLIHKDIS